MIFWPYKDTKNAIYPPFLLFLRKIWSRENTMFDDEEYMGDYEDEMEKSIEKYEAMLKDHDSVYFDSEEFEYIIDHYTKNNELKRSRQAVELAMSQHPESNKLKIKYARQYLLSTRPHLS